MNTRELLDRIAETCRCDVPLMQPMAVMASRTTLQRRTGIYRPFLTVRSKIPSVARSADSGTIGKRSLRSPLTFDQS